MVGFIRKYFKSWTGSPTPQGIDEETLKEINKNFPTNYSKYAFFVNELYKTYLLGRMNKRYPSNFIESSTDGYGLYIERILSNEEPDQVSSKYLDMIRDLNGYRYIEGELKNPDIVYIQLVTYHSIVDYIKIYGITDEIVEVLDDQISYVGYGVMNKTYAKGVRDIGLYEEELPTIINEWHEDYERLIPFLMNIFRSPYTRYDLADMITSSQGFQNRIEEIQDYSMTVLVSNREILKFAKEKTLIEPKIYERVLQDYEQQREKELIELKRKLSGESIDYGILQDSDITREGSKNLRYEQFARSYNIEVFPDEEAELGKYAVKHTERKPTIILSNKSPYDMKELVGDEFYYLKPEGKLVTMDSKELVVRLTKVTREVLKDVPEKDRLIVTRDIYLQELMRESFLGKVIGDDEKDYIQEESQFKEKSYDIGEETLREQLLQDIFEGKHKLVGEDFPSRLEEYGESITRVTAGSNKKPTVQGSYRIESISNDYLYEELQEMLKRGTNKL